MKALPPLFDVLLISGLTLILPPNLSPLPIFSLAGEEKEAGDATCSHSVPVDLAERYLQRNGAWDDEEGAQPI